VWQAWRRGLRRRRLRADRQIHHATLFVFFVRRSLLFSLRLLLILYHAYGCVDAGATSRCWLTWSHRWDRQRRW